MFRNADLLGEHRTLHGYKTRVNPRYSDESIDEYLKRVSPDYTGFFSKNFIYDGDTFEFTTYNFYKTNVKSVIKELCDVKKKILAEINLRLVSKFTLFKKPLVFPKFNYGFARFMSNPENTAICNNGTYHINLTLPTKLDKDGEIDNPEQFKLEHANAIRAIQWIEPLLVGLYGSPDILCLLDPSYAAGSQRLAFSRYIGVGTYDSKTMEKGKLLDSYSYSDTGKTNYYTEMHYNKSITTPYIPPATIGYDFNYNKFKKHGIELRIFDYFPEEHLEPIMNLIILACQHSLHSTIPEPGDSKEWVNLCMKAVRRGSATKIVYDFYSRLYTVFGIEDPCFLYNRFLKTKASMLHVANTLATGLYKNYSKGSICKKMSPEMKPVVLIDYNSLIKKEFKKLV
jgi:hypothetical protein